MNKLNLIARFVLTVLVIELLVFGCSSGYQASKGLGLKPLMLTKNLSISASDINILIGNLSGLAIDDEGIIYVADTRLQKIHLFTSDGHYLDSIGHKGKGPGEFIQLDPKIRILSDTLYVKDNSAKRISLFNLKSRKLSGTINIPNIKLKGIPMGYLKDIFPLSDGNLLVSFMNTYFSIPQEGDTKHKTTISIMNKSGEFIHRNLRQFPVLFPTDQRLIYLESNKMMVFTDLSFYPDTKMSMGSNGYLYVGNTDSLILRKYDTNGELIGTIQRRYKPAPLTDSDIDSILKGKGNTFERALNEAGFPDHWPVFHDFLFDDAGHCWIQLVNPGKSEQTWWIFNTDNEPKWKFKLPTEVDLYEVQKGEAYGIRQSREGLSSIVRYHVEGF